MGKIFFIILLSVFISCKSDDKVYEIQIEEFREGKGVHGTFLRDMKIIKQYSNADIYSAKMDSNFNKNLYDSIIVRIIEK